MTKLSIIIPVYNAAPTLERSIQSCLMLREELGGEVELLIVDDCSTDLSYQTIRAFEESESGITSFQTKENGGPGVARNVALEYLEHRNTDYVGFLDADDEIIPEGYAHAFLEGVGKNAEIIIHNGQVNRNGEAIPKYDHNRLTTSKNALTRKCLRGELDGSVIFSNFQHRYTRRISMSFRSGYYEDIAFQHLHLIRATHRHYGEEYGYLKNNRSESIVNTISKLHIDGLLLAFNDVYKSIKSLGLDLYPEFENDASYGMHGMVGRLIMDILKLSSETDKVSLLRYLQYVALDKFALDSFVPREKTTRDRATQKLFSFRTKLIDKSDIVTVS